MPKPISEAAFGYAERCRWTPAPSRLACGPFRNPRFHLLVTNHSAFFDVAVGLAHGGEESNLVRGVAVIDIIREPMDCLKHLIFHAHTQKSMRPEMRWQA